MRLIVPPDSSNRELGIVGIILFLGLIHGLIYTFLIPPWQHYDEPTHFEFAWLIANRPGLPGLNDYDQSMRREVAASMIEHNFFDSLGFRPNLLSIDAPIWIGISQVDDQALYYWFVALPLRLVQYTDVVFQLYLGRLFSLVLYLISIATAYLIIAEITPSAHPLRYLVPAVLAMLPSFTDLMTAINNDVGATAFFSLFLLVSVRLIIRGFSFPRLIALGVLALICYYTKNTVAIALLLIPIPVIFSVLKVQKSRAAWTITGLLALAVVPLIFTWGEAAYWYRDTPQEPRLRSSHPNVVIGQYVLKQTQLANARPSKIFQIIPQSSIQPLMGKNVTIGAWIWSDEPVAARTPILKSDVNYYQEVEIGLEPRFFAYHARIAEKPVENQIILQPFASTTDRNVTVYYDGITLVEGHKPLDITPHYNDATASNGQWGGESFSNLVRNASGSHGWIKVRPKVEGFINEFFPDKPSLILTSLIDWRGAGWYYSWTAQNLLRSFWAKFGWNHVPITTGNKPYRLLAITTLLGLLGAMVSLVRYRKKLPWEVLLLLAFAMLVIWGSTIVRGISSITGLHFIPAARYAYPAIVPTALVLCAGWLEGSYWINRFIRFPQKIQLGAFFAFFLLLDLISIISIVKFYS